MDTESAAAFWSYTHEDNDDEDGRVIQLAHDLKSQYGMLTGGELTLFLDKDQIEWGDNIRSQIDRALAGTTFFIPIVTPRYFASEECRRELIAFSQETKRLDVEALLLPVHYTNVPELSAQEPSDPAVVLVKEHKWEDWRSLCLEERTSANYRQGVRTLAERLVAVVRELTSDQATEATTAAATHADSKQEAEEDDSPRVIDLLADGEEAFPVWSAIMEAMSPEIDALSRLAEEATAEISASDARSGGAAGRLKVAVTLAERMKPHAAKIRMLGRDNAAVMVKIDPAINALIDAIDEDPAAAFSDDDVVSFVDTVRDMAQSARTALDATRAMSQSYAEVASVARVLRPPVRDIRAGLRGFTDAQAVFDTWDSRLAAIQQRHDDESDRPAHPTAS